MADDGNASIKSSDEATVDETAPVTTDTDKWQANAMAAKEANPEKFAKIKDFFRGYWARKKWALPLTVLVLIILILGIPFTRYKALGLFLKHDVTISVIDSVTARPVSGAAVTAGSKVATTNSQGRAMLHLAVGPEKIAVTKKYYQSGAADLSVKLLGSQQVAKVSLVATGRQVPITITNKITGKALADVTITALGTESKTDAKGKASIVLPAKHTTEKASLTLSGYNTSSVTIQITDQEVQANKFTLTPSGKLYFLSNLSGTIDVVKTNLDGSDRQTVLAGTGKEDPNNTALLASRDWKYLALLSNRDGNPGIYLINTANDEVTNIDGGSSTANFTLVGWSNHVFVYEVNRSNVPSWQSGATVLKSYDADAGKLYNLDQTTASGSDQSDWIGQYIGDVYLLDDSVVYSLNWSAGYNDFSQINSKQATLNTISPTGSDKKVVKSFSLDSGTQASDVAIQLKVYEPDGIYVYFPSGTQDNFYDYDDGQLTTDTKLTSQTFYNGTYDTYLLSPSGDQTFWSDVRDNQNVLFVGDQDGQNGKQIGAPDQYVPYGWYTDNYLLASIGGSVLYIMPSNGGSGVVPLKISDYYKPQLTFNGYGGGYGGL